MIGVAIVFLPLFSSLMCGIFNKPSNIIFVKIFTICSMTIVALLSSLLLYEQYYTSQKEYFILFQWLNVKILKFTIGIYIDRLTSTMYFS